MINKKRELPLDVIERWLNDNDWRVRQAAMNVCQGRDVPLDLIEKGLNDSNCIVRQAAMNACKGREMPLEVIERWLNDNDCDVRQAAMNACKGREMPLDLIEKGLNDNDWRVRQAAMNVCQGRDVPLDLIEKGLNDNDRDVRQAAMTIYKEKNIPFPITHTIVPPDTVYKKCLGGVIICASIPKDAQVRGDYGKKCRASAAVVTKVIGDLHGEAVGISMYDKKTMYYEGDEVVIEDFDMSDDECAAGFHFFCTIEEARVY